MFAVSRLGSYISRGVYTVSGPFQPSGGAIDIIVVEQQDGSFKSSPWYVRFGKFQSVLKATERVVSINVNGADADFHMFLDRKGESFFLREVDAEEGESEPCPFGDEMEVLSDIRRTQKSMSCNYDGNRTDMGFEHDGSNRRSLSRNNSRREKIFGLPIGRRSMKENGLQGGDAGVEADSVSPLERAEIAADLLEVRWTTNLRTGKNQNASVSDENKVDSSPSSEGNRASSEKAPINENDAQETSGKYEGGEEPLWKTADSHLGDEVGTSPLCSIDERFIEDSSVREGSVEELSLKDPNTKAKNIKETPLDDSKEEQFFFSDLDDSKVEKVEHIQTSTSGSSLESIEDQASDSVITDESHQVTCKATQDKLRINHLSLRLNSNKVSSPISFSKVRNDADEEAFTPVGESLPNMTFDGFPLNAPQPFGRSLDSTFEAFKMVDSDVPASPALNGGHQQPAPSQFTSDGSQFSEEIKRIISDPAVEVSLCRHFLSEGMGYEAAGHAFDAEKLDTDKFLSLGLDILENNKLVVRIGGLYFPWDAALPIASAIGSKGNLQILEPKGMIDVGQDDDKTSEGVAQKSLNSRSGSWSMWPFSRANSINRNYSSDIATESPKIMVGNTDVVVPRVTKKKLWAKSPSSEQLASLNLKEGKNAVIFTFTTAMFGEQQVDARIFLWKWNARIVISDVDGTITKSDVLGQFMPLMGMDWSQTGVTHLFSAIKENGYQLLFLSARSILQAYHTRQFLINLKQDGKALPEGPVLISPDGLFPSLYREVIRRAPHEFKIACLEDVKVLFPLDHNPFYAGFGNRDTDELSYLKVGIPRGKIFTINPKGEVVVNRRVDTKSYTSLHTLVHDMFPPTTLHEPEDYNSWNFWRLPPPDPII